MTAENRGTEPQVQIMYRLLDLTGFPQAGVLQS